MTGNAVAILGAAEGVVTYLITGLVASWALAVAHVGPGPLPEAVDAPLVPQARHGRLAPAAALVAEHGAGLANLMFCPPGATVVELFREGDPHVIYQRLSATFGLRYVGCQHGPRRAVQDMGTSNFVLNLTWFFEVCLQGHGIRA